MEWNKSSYRMNLLKVIYLMLVFMVGVSWENSATMTSSLSTTDPSNDKSSTEDTKSTNNETSTMASSPAFTKTSVSENLTTETESTTNDETSSCLEITSKIVTVGLILLISTLVLHCFFILHYIIKIWYYCNNDVDEFYFYQQSRSDLQDYDRNSNSCSLRRISDIFHKKNRQSIIKDNDSYRSSDIKQICSTCRANDGFLNLDRCINQGRQSKNISYVFENQNCECHCNCALSDLKHSEHQDEEKASENVSNRSAVLPDIKVDCPQDSTNKNCKNTDGASLTSNEESRNLIKMDTLEIQREVDASDVLGQDRENVHNKKDKEGTPEKFSSLPRGGIAKVSTTADIHNSGTMHAIVSPLQDSHWHVAGNDVEIITDSSEKSSMDPRTPKHDCIKRNQGSNRRVKFLDTPFQESLMTKDGGNSTEKRTSLPVGMEYNTFSSGETSVSFQSHKQQSTIRRFSLFEGKGKQSFEKFHQRPSNLTILRDESVAETSV